MDPTPPENSTSETDTIRDIVDAASKVRDNAEQLYSEAKVLRAAGALARALFLHQISLEECAKVDMLGAWAVSQQITGRSAYSKRFQNALRNHKDKNATNAYLLTATEAEMRARDAGDWQTAINVFACVQKQFHEDSNTAKNTALYVDVQNGPCSTPVEQITEAVVEEIMNRNETFLAHANNHVKAIARLAENPVSSTEFSRWFLDRAEELRKSHTTDPEHFLAILLSEALGKFGEVENN